MVRTKSGFAASSLRARGIGDLTLRNGLEVSLSPKARTVTDRYRDSQCCSDPGRTLRRAQRQTPALRQRLNASFSGIRRTIRAHMGVAAIAVVAFSDHSPAAQFRTTFTGIGPVRVSTLLSMMKRPSGAMSYDSGEPAGCK